METRIKEARQSKGISMAELAKQIGVSISLISRYEKGDVSPNLDNLVSIADALGVSTDYLLMRKESKEEWSKLDSNVRAFTIARAGSRCELCGRAASFFDKENLPYLDVYYLKTDNPEIVWSMQACIALCPNCYRRVQVLQDPSDMAKLERIALSHDIDFFIEVETEEEN